MSDISTAFRIQTAIENNIKIVVVSVSIIIILLAMLNCLSLLICVTFLPSQGATTSSESRSVDLKSFISRILETNDSDQQVPVNREPQAQTIRSAVLENHQPNTSQPSRYSISKVALVTVPPGAETMLFRNGPRANHHDQPTGLYWLLGTGGLMISIWVRRNVTHSQDQYLTRFARVSSAHSHGLTGAGQ